MFHLNISVDVDAMLNAIANKLSPESGRLPLKKSIDDILKDCGPSYARGYPAIWYIQFDVIVARSWKSS